MSRPEGQMILKDGTILSEGVELGKVAQAYDGTWGIYITFSQHESREEAVMVALDRIDEIASWQPYARTAKER